MRYSSPIRRRLADRCSQSRLTQCVRRSPSHPSGGSSPRRRAVTITRPRQRTGVPDRRLRERNEWRLRHQCTDRTGANAPKRGADGQPRAPHRPAHHAGNHHWSPMHPPPTGSPARITRMRGHCGQTTGTRHGPGDRPTPAPVDDLHVYRCTSSGIGMSDGAPETEADSRTPAIGPTGCGREHPQTRHPSSHSETLHSAVGSLLASSHSSSACWW